MDIVIGKKARAAIGAVLVIASIAVVSFLPTSDLSNHLGFLLFWFGVLCLIWATRTGPFWGGVARRAVRQTGQILLFSGLATGAIVSLFAAFDLYDTAYRVPLLVLAVLFAIGTVSLMVRGLYRWGRALAKPPVAPVTLSPNMERMRVILFWIRSAASVLLLACAIALFVYGHPFYGACLLVLGLLFAFGAYRGHRMRPLGP